MQSLFDPSAIRDRVVVFDTETSGFYSGARVVEITAMAIESRRPVNHISTLIDSTSYIDGRATAVHGIRVADLAGQPRPEQVYPELMRFVDGCPMVGHNVSFDKRMLARELALLGMMPPQVFLCTMKLARQKLKLPSHKLADVYRYLFGSCDYRAHRTFGDVMMTAGIYLALSD